MQEVHGNKYDYRKVVYVKSWIVCIICGLFIKLPKKHLVGQGCLKCSYAFKANMFKSTTNKFVKKAHIIYKNRYIMIMWITLITVQTLK